MLAFVIRRSLLGFISLVGASILVFVIMSVLGGDVVLETLMGGEAAARVPEETLKSIRHQLGLDRPPVIRYVDWIRKLGTGEMGYSFSERSSLGKLIQRRIQPTFQLAIQAVLLAWIIGLPIGALSALRPKSPADYIIRVISTCGLSLPVFWVAIMVTTLMAVRFHWAAPIEQEPFWHNPWLSLQQTFVPSLVLAISLAAYIARMSRASLLEVLREDYVRTARAKGLRERLVITRHTLKIALLPVLTLSGVHLGHLLGGTVVIEQVFGINGMGRMAIDAVIKRDTVVVQNVVLLLTLVFVVVNLLVDLAYGWLDPRIRRA